MNEVYYIILFMRLCFDRRQCWEFKTASRVQVVPNRIFKDQLLEAFVVMLAKVEYFEELIFKETST